MVMDYKLLLMKYMDYILDSEGTNFVDTETPDDEEDWWYPARFTEEEWLELIRLNSIIYRINAIMPQIGVEPEGLEDE